MPTDVIMPKVDMVMDSGTVVHWYKAEGDPVVKGEPLFDIETDKSTMVIESPASGTLAHVTAPVDTTVPVASVIAWILAPGENPPSAAAPHNGADRQPVAVAAESSDRDEAAASAGQAVSVAAPRPRATPLARKLASDYRLDLHAISGSGPGGRIGKQDVLRALEQTRTSSTSGNGAAQAIEPTAVAPVASPRPAAPESDGRLEPLSGVRRIIAQRMLLSAAIPQFTITIDVDMRAVVHLRDRLAYRPSITALVARVVAPLLLRHPSLNASFRDDGIWFHRPVHLGIALDSNGDLLVPVIRDAQRLTLQELDARIKDLRVRADAHQLPPGELHGSTFSISNLGMFGIDRFTALINPPEAAILAVGRIVEQPVREDQSIAWRPVLTLTLSADHRVTDGAAAARFMQDVRAMLEEPYLLL